MTTSRTRTPKSPMTGRLGSVDSSPVRDLLALIDRPEVISFAGGLPSPELFDLDALQQSFHEVLSPATGRRALHFAEIVWRRLQAEAPSERE